MIRPGWLIFFGLILPGSLSAQSLPVKSGEHGDFTRIVVTIPDGASWSLARGQEPRTYRLDVGADGISFDTSTVFDRIDRSRISALNAETGGSNLRFELSCDCVATGFLHQEDMVVVDVRQGSEPTDADASDPKSTGLSFGANAFSEIRLGSAPGIGPMQRMNALLPSLLSEQLHADDQPGTVPAESTLEFERDLAEQIASAATGGLLRPALRPVPAGKPHDLEDDMGRETHHREGSDMRSIQDSLEAALSSDDPTNPEARIRISGQACVDDDELDFNSWGEDDALETLIPSLRVKLYGEFDRIDETALKEIARAYVRIGFGAEARAILELDAESGDRVITALAGMVDGLPDGSGVFAGQTACDGRAALWSLLGSRELPNATPINVPAILRTFEELPLLLRNLIGPELSTRFAREGDVNAARSVLARLERATGDMTEDMILGRARVDRIDGAVDEAHHVLNEIAGMDGPNAVEATIESIELSSENGSDISPRMVELTAAYATELRKTDEGPKMWLAHARALLSNRRYDEAFTSIDSSRDIPPEVLESALGEAMSAVSRIGDDVSFLKRIVGRGPSRGLPPETVISIADRLIALGMPEQAERWLTETGISTASRPYRMSKARTLVALAKPEEAEIALIGLQGDDVLQLRAEARRQMGDFSYVQTAYERLGQEDGARSAAWLAGDWPTVANGEAGALSSAAALAESEDAVFADARPSLQLAETIAGESSQTRATLEELLATTRLTDQ